MSLIIYGDPHGVWSPLRQAASEHPPQAVVILGDCELSRPLRQELADIFRIQASVLFIYGNHDKDSTEFWDNLVEDHPTGNLHTRVVRVGGYDVAGLAGVFKRTVWLPPDKPLFKGRDEMLRGMPHQRRWRQGIPLRRRDAIFPEDFEILAGQRADVLVCHEAPTAHPFGFAVIDELARRMQVRLVVFGHHHKRMVSVTVDGVRTVGLAKADVYRIEPGDLG